MSSAHVQSLQHLRPQLESILEQLPLLDQKRVIQSSVLLEPGCTGVIPPVEPIPGTRAFRDAVKREIETIDKFLKRPDRDSVPGLSTNASFYISLWRQIIAAPPPIVSLGESFRTNNTEVVKVDIVADGGRNWIRINTCKNSRILAEFREHDSYLTDDDDEPFGQGDSSFADFDNSVLKMGRALTEARQKQMNTSKSPPDLTITLRLTRLDPAPSREHHDPRIQITIDKLREMNLHVVLGDLPPVDEALTSRSIPSDIHYYPTHRINLDLSMLIALISEITHCELPRTADEAYARFHSNSSDSATIDDDADSQAHGHALGSQLVHEMSAGLINEIRKHTSQSGTTLDSPYEFWTSSEAKHRCLAIISTIGGPREKMRAEAMFSADGAERFWTSSGSRYRDKPLDGLIPIHVIEESLDQDQGQQPSSEFTRFCQTCSAMFSHSKDGALKDAQKNTALPADPSKVIRLNAKLTEHTVLSMLQGAMCGYTTLTANKASVRAILREAAKFPSAEFALDDGQTNGHAERAAVFWVTEPRSLAEQMQSAAGLR
ncbi:hypothetical protein SISNIDRAFT_406857 [Sistotremastrum niveocremeum HHB9708]|uniref:DUF1308 domain-containing protein n=1 Tax=Sistotremastrum niveocremeum HHB9708 TaxID=1314777 RepID=A0A164YIC5_9AGAM|nr:hypothetical protein SISNIDRAFT_406857 [Sistotremastrum niveocremeum HHB9708]